MSAFPTPISTLAAVLNKRQITTDQASMMQMKICTKAEAEDDLGMPIYGDVEFCERLPYFGLQGQHLDFARYRINYKKGDDSYVDKNGKTQQRPKYISPRGKGRQQLVYLPKVEGFDWENLICNPNEPLLITEGEYKSIAACQKGIPCVGLGGIWTFGQNSPRLAYPLDTGIWIDKNVWICYDADPESSVDNPLKMQVGQAALALATKLYKLGAKPRLMYIARTTTFTEARKRNQSIKMGLDDYIHAGGDPEDLFATAVDPIECRDMAELNSQYAVCQGKAGVGVMDLGLGKIYKVSDFKTVEMPRIRKSHSAKGAVTEVFVANEFLKQRDVPVVKEIVFEPSWRAGYDREESTYNTWMGWPTLELNGATVGAEQRAHIVGTWRTLIEKLFGEHADYFERWTAHMIQQPGVKTSIGVIICSVLNGVGKSLLGEVLRGLVGRDYGKACDLQRVGSHFNSILEKCLFLQMDEADGLQDGLENKLNDLITSDQTTIERKGFDSYTINNYMRCFMTTNSVHPIRLNEQNRRWFVVTAGVQAHELVTWAPWCDMAAKVLKSTAGLWTLRQHLEGVSLVDWNPTARVPVTEAMESMVDSSRSWNSVILQGLWEQVHADWAEGKLWLLTAALGHAAGGKVWERLKAHVKSEGGRTLAHTFRAKYDQREGKQSHVTKGLILDLNGHLPAKQDKEKKWHIDTSGEILGFDQDWSAAALRATQAWQELNRQVKGDEA